jgi:hypothetical protein
MELNQKDIFKKRLCSKITFFVMIVGLYIISAVLAGFKNGTAFFSIPSGIIWLFQKFIPTKNSVQYFPVILDSAIKTILLSISSTMVSAIFALFLSIIGSNTTGINIVTKIISKIIASFFRNMPVVAWSLILLFSFKQSEFTGFLSLFFITFGYLTRAFSETIDEVATDNIEALKSTGASYLQIIFCGVFPTVFPQFLSWLLYFIENSIREATLIGILTGTGIGFTFNLYYRSFRYDAAGLVILIVTIIVISIELLSNKLRSEMM